MGMNELILESDPKGSGRMSNKVAGWKWCIQRRMACEEQRDLGEHTSFSIVQMIDGVRGKWLGWGYREGPDHKRSYSLWKEFELYPTGITQGF